MGVLTMKLLMCNCRWCKSGRHRWRQHIKARKHSARSIVKVKLKRGETDSLPTKIYIGYTD